MLMQETVNSTHSKRSSRKYDCSDSTINACIENSIANLDIGVTDCRSILTPPYAFSGQQLLH
jgi:hypothetical protein